MKKKILCTVLLMLMACTALCCHAKQSGDIVILYTNDVHCAVEENIGYAGLAAMKAHFEEQGAQVILADCGDAVQGEPIGTLSEGEYIIEIMNAVGYDVAAVGNHEFDYGHEQFLRLRDMASFPYTACNIRYIDSGETVAAPYVTIERAGVKLAFIGVSTPCTIVSSVPSYFSDEKGEILYSFDQDLTGETLYETVQHAIDAAKAEGADYIIALCHLGIEEECMPWTSVELVENTSGIDVLLDAHSHSIIPCDRLRDKDGQWVLHSQTGTKFGSVGMLLIEENGSVSTGLIESFDGKDEKVEECIAGIKEEYEQISQTVVAHTSVDLTIHDPETGERIVRTGETNLGDLCTDACMHVTGAQVAFLNGGGMQSGIKAGDITYGDLLRVYPFGNEICVTEASGQDILNALEMGCRTYPAENGSFPHVAGMTYELHSDVESSVIVDEDGMFDHVAGEYRVKNVLIGGEPLDLDKTYTLASHNYYIKEAGGGMAMFQDNVLLQDCIMLDNQLLTKYIVEYLGGTVGEEYADPYGQGRIVIR